MHDMALHEKKRYVFVVMSCFYLAQLECIHHRVQDHRHLYNAINIEISFASAKKHDANVFRRLPRSAVLLTDVAVLDNSFRKIF